MASSSGMSTLRLADGHTGRSTGSQLRGGYVCLSGVHRQSRGPVGGNIHTGILARVMVDNPPPPGSGGRSLLLILAADPPPRISHHFPTRDALRLPLAKPSYIVRPPFRRPYRQYLRECFIQMGASAHSMARSLIWKTHHRSPIPTSRDRTRPRNQRRRSRLHQTPQHCSHSRGCRLGWRGRYRYQR